MIFHDADAGDGARSTSALTGPAVRRAHVQQHVDEQRGEDLRLAYVALTRARHQAVVWWAGSCGEPRLGAGRLLFARDAEGNVATVRRQRSPTDAAAADRLRSRARARSASSASVLGAERVVGRAT